MPIAGSPTLITEPSMKDKLDASIVAASTTAPWSPRSRSKGAGSAVFILIPCVVVVDRGNFPDYYVVAPVVTGAS